MARSIARSAMLAGPSAATSAEGPLALRAESPIAMPATAARALVPAGLIPAALLPAARAVIPAALALAAAILAAPIPASAQAPYPDRPIKIIVPQPPGGGFDTVARVLADRLGPALGQGFVVENRPGAGTLVGTEAAAKAPPDGYTLLLGALSNIALNPGLYAKLPYDPLKDFTPVGLAVTWSYTLVARKDLPYRDLAELIAFARANPEKITYASAGKGSGQHIAMAVTAQLAGVQLTHVPYRGAQAAYQDILGGRVDLFFDITSTAYAQVEAGSVRALAVSSGQRQAIHADVPNVAETGVAPLDMESWFGLFAPAATPPAILERLRAELDKAIAAPDVAALFAKTGGRVLKLTPAETELLIKRDIDRWTRLIEAAGLRG
jgi:tripartite-type tricarboxylate transporter receptor subunit TctC